MVYAQTEVCKDLIALHSTRRAARCSRPGAGRGGRGDGPAAHPLPPRGRRGRAGVRLRRRLRRLLRRPGGRPDGGPCAGRTPSAGSASSRTLAPWAASCSFYARHDRGFALLSMRSVRLPPLTLGPRGRDTDGTAETVGGATARQHRYDADDWRLRAGPPSPRSRSRRCVPTSTSPCGTAASSWPATPRTSSSPPAPRASTSPSATWCSLARALAHRTATGSDELLDYAYSATCLRRVWQAERFSYDVDDAAARRPRRHALEGPLPAGPPGSPPPAPPRPTWPRPTPVRFGEQAPGSATPVRRSIQA
ncbi:4-hydroxybenzoate 3-monooxygenase [Streptomyces violaceorubidus]